MDDKKTLEHYDPQQYEKLVDTMYETYGDVVLPAEYAYFLQENTLRLLIRLARYKAIARQLGPADDVLEIGSGSGVGAMFLAQHCRSVLGIDLKEHEVNEARGINKRPNVRFEVGDFFDLPAEASFDTIVNLDVVEHLPEAEGERLIERTTRHLRDTGMLVLGTPSIHSYPYQSALSQAAHVRCYDLDELTAIVGRHYGRILRFSMNDELVHTGFSKLAWFYLLFAFYPRRQA